MSRIGKTGSELKKGSRWGTVIVIGEPFAVWHGSEKKPKRRLHCVVRCDCGEVFVSLCFNLRGLVSCRKCLILKSRKTDEERRETARKYRAAHPQQNPIYVRKGRKIKHGLSHDRLYQIWDLMLRRCNDPRNNSYPGYGGRGIRVCAKWAANVKEFVLWAQENGYRPHLTIDRIDNDGNYEPGNCRWVTRKQNCRNTRQSVMITAFGETKCLVEWKEDQRCLVSYEAVRYRIRNGWLPELAVSSPRVK